MDYQKKYLEETIRARVMEVQFMQLRFPVLQDELADAQKKLTKYIENNKEKNVGKEKNKT